MSREEYDVRERIAETLEDIVEVLVGINAVLAVRPNAVPFPYPVYPQPVPNTAPGYPTTYPTITC